MKNNELIEKFTGLLSDIEDAEAISVTDFTEERKPNMIIVSIDSIKQCHPPVPDYEYQISITVDSFIADDPNGSKFNAIIEEVQNKMNLYIFKGQPLSSLFGEIPVVGLLEDGASYSITNESNRCEMKYLVYISF